MRAKAKSLKQFYMCSEDAKENFELIVRIGCNTRTFISDTDTELRNLANRFWKANEHCELALYELVGEFADDKMRVLIKRVAK